MKEQINPEPIRWELVNWSIIRLKDLIDQDLIENHEIIKSAWALLTNDEQVEVNDGMKDKAPDSGPRGRAYRSLLKDYLSYVSDS